MPEYAFVAKNQRGKILRARMRAETETQARQQLEQQHYQVLELVERRGLFAKIDAWLAAARPPSLFELAMTSRQLAVMLTAGIPMTRALIVLNQLPVGGRLARAWDQVSVAVQQGEYLSRALGKHPDVFGMLYTGMVKAGETSGQLAANLTCVADHLEKEVLLRGKLRSALTYPAFIFILCLVLSVVIVQHILPQFLNGLFKGSGVQLPWPTRLLVEITAFFNNPPAMGGALVIGLVGLTMLASYLRTPAGKFRFQKIMLAIPALRPILAKTLAARFCRTMATLVQSGIPIVLSLDLTNAVLGSYVLSEYVDHMKTTVKEGGKLSEGLRRVPFFPPVVATFVDLGEETGRIPELLMRLAIVFEEDLEVALATFTSLIEPVMVAVMGGFVGFVLIAIFIPLYKILGNF